MPVIEVRAYGGEDVEFVLRKALEAARATRCRVSVMFNEISIDVSPFSALDVLVRFYYSQFDELHKAKAK